VTTDYSWTGAANTYSTCIASATMVAQNLSRGAIAAAEATQVALNGATANLQLGTADQDVFASSAGSAAVLALLLVFPVGIGVLVRTRRNA
jgi:hypothetical protein